MTQAELARRVNVTQGAIAKVANYNPNGSSFLHIIARELGTTPAYLTGETDDPDEDAPPLPELTSQERELFESYAALDDVQRQALLTIAKSMAGGDLPKRSQRRRGDQAELRP